MATSTACRIARVAVRSGKIRIFGQDRLMAVHPNLDRRGQCRMAAGHRSLPLPTGGADGRSGEIVVQRSLAFYDAVARRLAGVAAKAMTCQCRLVLHLVTSNQLA
jgi:hypothetical protein